MTLLPPASLLMQFVKDSTDHTNRQGTRMKIFYTDCCCADINPHDPHSLFPSFSVMFAIENVIIRDDYIMILKLMLSFFQNNISADRIAQICDP